VKTETFHLEFLTPCFCAGANQSMAEVRAPSIRGKLRWWFRVLGGTVEQESEVFGSVRAKAASASSVIVRVDNATLAGKWQPIQFSGVSNTGYLLYFAWAAVVGARWVAGGAIPQGARFVLAVSWRRKVSGDAQATFDLALKCFLILGSLGLRSTRGLGAFECKEIPFTGESYETLITEVKGRAPGFYSGFGLFVGAEDQWLDALGSQLRGLRQGFSAGRPGRSNPTPLGSSNNPRQASAVHLRPVRERAKARIVVFEAPAQKVLGRESRKGAPRLLNGVPAPGSMPQNRR
jgi:CRISPR-associated protein Cmr1